VKEAKVQVSARYNSASEETDALGRFDVPYFAEGAQVTVYASVDGMRSETQTLTLDEGGKTGLELKLTEKTDCAISGNVRTASGRVLRGARIIVAKEGDTGSWVASEYASATGIFEIKNLPAGTFVFMIEDQNRYQNIPCEGAKVTLEPGEHRENFELICGGQGTGRIAGRVIDHEGKPVPIAEVRVPNTALTTAADTEGFFSIDGLEEEFVTLEVEPFRETPVVLKDVKVGTLNLVVKVLPREAVSGKVIDASNRSPVVGARVRVIPQIPFQSTGVAISEAETDDQGQFEVEDMPQGRVSIHVSKAGFAPFNEEFQNPGDIPITVQLQAGGVLEGYVTDANAEPVGGASVGGRGRTASGSHANYEPVTTDEKGYYKFDTVAPDSSVELSATHPNFVAGKATAEVVGLGPSRADITIGLSGQLTVMVTHNGAPVPADQMMVSLYNQYYDGNRRPTEPKISEGMVVYDPLPPGKAQGSISLKLGEEDTARLHESFQEEVVAGQDTVVEVAFETGTGAVSGTVVTPPGMRRVHVLMSRQGERETRSSQLLEGGSFLFEDLAPGDYSVRIIAETNDGKAMQRNQAVVVENDVEVSVAFDLSNSVNISGTVPGLPAGMRYHGVLVKGDVAVPGGDSSMESLQQHLGQGAAFLQIMPDGTFESVGLEPGAYTVVVFGIEITGAPVNPEELSVEVMGSAPLEIPEGGAEGLVLDLG
jgi:hypothetical protein